MLVRYSYFTKRFQMSESFIQADEEDFRNFLRCRINVDLLAIVVEFEDGRVYIWQRSMVKVRRADYHNGWAQVSQAREAGEHKSWKMNS